MSASPVTRVTGGARGIGAAIVAGLAARGQRVAFSYAGNDREAGAVAANGLARGYRSDIADPGGL